MRTKKKKGTKQNYYKPVSEDKQFFTNDGKTITSLAELPKFLRKMPEEVFQHHVYDEKHDFAEWVESTIGHKSLARNMRSYKSKTPLAKCITDQKKRDC